MSYDEETQKWLDDHADEIPPEIEDEINGDDIVSLEELQEQEYEEEDSEDYNN